MTTIQVQPGLEFGGYRFSPPSELNEWEPSAAPGIYAILVPDPFWRTQPFLVIYFGETADLSTCNLGRRHEKYWSWLQLGGPETDLRVATYAMPDSSVLARKAIQARLITQYQPVCNGRPGAY